MCLAMCFGLIVSGCCRVMTAYVCGEKWQERMYVCYLFVLWIFLQFNLFICSHWYLISAVDCKVIEVEVKDIECTPHLLFSSAVGQLVQWRRRRRKHMRTVFCIKKVLSRLKSKELSVHSYSFDFSIGTIHVRTPDIIRAKKKNMFNMSK